MLLDSHVGRTPCAHLSASANFLLLDAIRLDPSRWRVAEGVGTVCMRIDALGAESAVSGRLFAAQL
jgi:hypothetical protein